MPDKIVAADVFGKWQGLFDDIDFLSCEFGPAERTGEHGIRLLHESRRCMKVGRHC